MKYKAIIFDLDGTLLNTLHDLAEAVNKGLGFMGFPQHEIEAYRYFVGEGREILARKVLPEDKRDPEHIERLVGYIDTEYLKTWRNHTVPYPGVVEMLNALNEKGIKMAILSNKPDDYTGIMVSELLPHWHFDFVTGILPGIPRKPDPAEALKIAGLFNVRPSEFIFMGDSSIDIKTALAAGMYPVGALWGFRTREELVGAGAKAVMEKPAEILDLLGK